MVKDTDLSWFLTGGTALSRFYFQHRYSDDLDFFINNDPNYHDKVRTIVLKIQSAGFKIEDKTPPGSDYYSQYWIIEAETELKIDFVNDIPIRSNYPIKINNLLIDNLDNILTNKISAIYRFAAKDVADIWVLSKNYNFKWNEAFEIASQKVMGIEMTGIGRLFHTIPDKVENEINWIESYDHSSFLQDLKTIGRDILEAKPNSLAPSNAPSLEFKISL